MLKAAALSVGAAAVGVETAEAAGRFRRISVQKGESKVKRYPNEFFYDKDGKFLQDRARQAFYEMFAAYNYPTSKFLDENIWFVDFGMGDFANVGMGGIIWLNRCDEKGRFSYFGHDIYLLPGQQIAEHSHVATDYPAKMESWQVRYGSVYNWSEGEETTPAISAPAESQKDSVKCKHCEFLQVGDIRDLGELGKWHFLQGGPEGTIVTEYANYHDFKGLRFSNPNAKLD